MLFGVSAVRLFRSSGVRPFAIGGLALSATQERLRLCFADRDFFMNGMPHRAIVSCDEADVIETQRDSHTSIGLFLTVGGGVEIPVGSRVNIVADVRVSLAPTAMLVRPGVGLAIGF